jgi:hypothetical protein
MFNGDAQSRPVTPGWDLRSSVILVGKRAVFQLAPGVAPDERIWLRVVATLCRHFAAYISRPLVLCS